MVNVSTTDIRRRLSEYLELSRREPITISSRGVRRRAVLVSADFYDRALDALGDHSYAPPARTPEQELADELSFFFD